MKLDTDASQLLSRKDGELKKNQGADAPGDAWQIERTGTRTEQANLRTDQAHTRTDEANTRTKLADLRRDKAKTQTEALRHRIVPDPAATPTAEVAT